MVLWDTRLDKKLNFLSVVKRNSLEPKTRETVLAFIVSTILYHLGHFLPVLIKTVFVNHK